VVVTVDVVDEVIDLPMDSHKVVYLFSTVLFQVYQQHEEEEGAEEHPYTQ